MSRFSYAFPLLWATSNTPHRFNNKRTPSWTDRILWRGFVEQGEGHRFGTVREVIDSDHEPVYCLLDLSGKMELCG